IFSTMLMPAHLPKPGEWWYYVPETGQHVGFFSRQSLDWVARKHGLHVSTDGAGLHMLTERPVNQWVFKALAKMKVSVLANLARRREGLRGKDSLMLRDRLYK
ncbi:MAG: hypothetical protein KGQ89_01720, partial [Verrucomicrobia bacterium]|nr:hypothetical protein [Verrucomicrobiota bacterium]